MRAVLQNWDTRVPTEVESGFGILKVTVRFETDGNGQNEIVSHMDRSEIKLYNSEKIIVISHTKEI